MVRNHSFRKVALAIIICTLLPVCSSAKRGAAWLRDAVFYQIYPSSYMDSNGDGMGDLPGITSRLDYIKSIGVNVIWLNPVYVSGWTDGGYDVIDYYKVDPRFGTNSDLVELVEKAHAKGLRVCMDLVAGHTSTKCEWFTQSMEKDPNQRYSDYYVWTNEISNEEKAAIQKRHQEADPATSLTGKFVEADAPRAKYYLKNFFESQPALNYGFYERDPKCPWQQSMDAPGPQATRQELKNIMTFWIRKGVDGFRVDMASSLVKNDPDKKGTMALWKEMHSWYETQFPQCALIAEWSNPALSIPAGFDIDFMLHFGITGYPSLFFAKNTPHHQDNYDQCYFDLSGEGKLDDFISHFTHCYDITKDLGYMALPTSNHDFQRANIGERNTLPQLKVAMTFFLTMPGVPFIYYGDEIGMKYIPNLPNKEGSTDRAGSRTPMQWAAGATAGFSTGSADKLFLPVDTDNGRITVESEEKDPNSMLNFVRDMLQLRKGNAALGNDGGWQLLSSLAQPYPMVYLRDGGNEKYVIALNPSRKKVNCEIAKQSSGTVSITRAVGKGTYKAGKSGDRITMDGVSAVIFKVK